MRTLKRTLSLRTLKMTLSNLGSTMQALVEVIEEIVEIEGR